MPFENIIFDLDGTLVDSLPGIEYSVDCALAECGYAARPASLRPLIGPPIRDILSTITGATPDRLDQIESAFRASYDTNGWLKTRLREEALETLFWLAQTGCRLYMVTNKPEQPARRIMAHFGLPTLFTRMLSPDSASPRYSSKSAMIRCLLDQETIKARQSLMVGDTEEDLQAAQQNGMAAVLFADGYGEIRTSCVQLRGFGELRAVVSGVMQ